MNDNFQKPNYKGEPVNSRFQVNHIHTHGLGNASNEIQTKIFFSPNYLLNTRLLMSNK
jgi:hypothetical protein